MRDPIRIASFSGYAGDRFTAVAEVMAGDPVDVLIGDYLAEISLAPLAAAYRRHPERGYVEYVRAQLRPHLADLASRGIKVVTNAGGFNPAGLAAALRADVAELGGSLRVAHVQGDDVVSRLVDLRAAGHSLPHLDSGLPLETWGHEPAVANAYLGGWGIAAALAHGADVVVCGRVTDASLVVGPAAWWHGWGPEEWDALAGAVVAGHVIECGAQAQGGNFSGFAAMSAAGRLTKPGFPIAEIAADGSAMITKHAGQGGNVTRDTVIAQLLYEIQGPCYLNPDVTVRLDGVRVMESETDRVVLTGAVGGPPPPTTKVALFATCGWQTAQQVLVTAPDTDAKLALLEEQLRAEAPRGVDLVFTQIGITDPDAREQWGATVAVRILAVAEDRADLDAFGLAARVGALYLSSFSGFYTDIATPMREARKELVAYWPGLLAQAELEHQVVLDDGTVLDIKGPVVHEAPVELAVPGPRRLLPKEPTARAPLAAVVHARSGDKGGDSSLGVWAIEGQAWPWLTSTLTIDLLRRLLPEAAVLDIERYELPHLHALLFVLKGLLGTGGSSTTRLDQVGKAVGDYLRSRSTDIPVRLLP